MRLAIEEDSEVGLFEVGGVVCQRTPVRPREQQAARGPRQEQLRRGVSGLPRHEEGCLRLFVLRFSRQWRITIM